MRRRRRSGGCGNGSLWPAARRPAPRRAARQPVAISGDFFDSFGHHLLRAPQPGPWHRPLPNANQGVSTWGGAPKPAVGRTNQPCSPVGPRWCGRPGTTRAAPLWERLFEGLRTNKSPVHPSEGAPDSSEAAAAAAMVSIGFPVLASTAQPRLKAVHWAPSMHQESWWADMGTRRMKSHSTRTDRPMEPPALRSFPSMGSGHPAFPAAFAGQTGQRVAMNPQVRSAHPGLPRNGDRGTRRLTVAAPGSRSRQGLPTDPMGTRMLLYDASKWTIGFWWGVPAHRTTIDPSTRQLGLPA